jgi:hypothetical protein
VGDTPQRLANAPDGGPTDVQGGIVEVLAQLLGEVAIIEPGIRRLPQLADALAHGGWQAASRRPGARPMGQPCGAFRAEAVLQPLELPDREAQGPGALRIGDASGEGGLEQARARSFLPAHRECLHGVTFSLSS